MDATVRCRYSGTPFASFASSATGRTSSAPAGLHTAPPAPQDRRRAANPRRTYKERPP